MFPSMFPSMLPSTFPFTVPVTVQPPLSSQDWLGTAAMQDYGISVLRVHVLDSEDGILP